MAIEDYKWYVVHTYSGYEKMVAENIKKVVDNRGLHDQIAEVRIPVETVEEIKNGKRREVERKLFPGYVLVKLAVSYNEKAEEQRMTDEVWYIIRNTRGVTGFVGPDGRPVPLTEAESIALGVEQHTVDVNYEVGDLVTIIYGSFEGFSGTVRSIDVDNDTVVVTIPMMGRETPLELALDQVEPAVD